MMTNVNLVESMSEDAGLIPRILHDLFRELSARSSDTGYSFHVEVSYLEIYCKCLPIRYRSPYAAVTLSMLQ